MILRKQSFESLLESFDADSPEGWPLKGKSLPYSELQIAMEKACGHTCRDEGGSTAGKAPSQQAQQLFFAALLEEVQSVDRHFIQAATHVLRLSGWRMRVKLGALRAFMRKSAEDQQRAKLAEEVQWAQQYVAMNRIALQRLLEQYDRSCPTRAGARFLKECWDPDAQAGQFLKTPLLDELKALKRLLLASVSDQAALVMLTPRTRAGSLERSSLSVPRDAPAWNGSALSFQRQGASGPIGPLPATQMVPKSAFA